MIVFLVPVGRSRFELYSETEEPRDEGEQRPEGGIRRRLRQASLRWQELVERARRGTATGRIARWRDVIVCRLAETIAEQRTLWALREAAEATARYPSILGPDVARGILTTSLSEARRHHLRWLIVDFVFFVVSGLFALIPGPNLLAYYLAFRVIGHVQSWRGARHAMDRTRWTCEADDRLAELAALADQPREARASRVAAIAAQLNLSRLSAFFDRVAVRSG
ncbi:MAG: hypothetical protein AB7P22_03230 [Vicinamibacterales bacterium]